MSIIRTKITQYILVYQINWYFIFTLQICKAEHSDLTVSCLLYHSQSDWRLNHKPQGLSLLCSIGLKTFDDDYINHICFLQVAKKAKSKQASPQKRSRKSKGGADADESQGSLFDIVKAGKGALRVCFIVHFSYGYYQIDG